MKSTPTQYLRDVQILYQLKCKALNKIINPYSLHFCVHNHVDPIHWATSEHLLHFIRKFPEHELSKSVRFLCFKTISAILHTNVNNLPSHFFDEDTEHYLVLFIQNISAMDEYLRKVESNKIPPKTIDVLIRLLVLIGKEDLWIHKDLKYKIESKESVLERVMHDMLNYKRELDAFKRNVSK